jgi:hypothetical protein
MTAIPRSNAPGALAVTDGSEFVGSIVKHDHSYFSFDADGILIGEYRSLQAAMRSVPARQVNRV